MASPETLKEAFNEMSVDISNNLLDFCVVLCVKHRLDEESLADAWKAFSLKFGHENPTLELLEEMERKELMSTKTTKRQITSSTMEVSKKTFQIAVIECKGTFKSKSNLDIPLGTELYKYFWPLQLVNGTPGNLLTASPKTPQTPVTPEALNSLTKYSDRKNSGATVCTFGKTEHNWASGEPIPVQITELGQKNSVQTTEWRGMWNTVRDLRYLIDENSLKLAEQIMKKHSLEEPVPFSDRCQDRKIFGGLVTKFNKDKTNNYNCIEMQDLFDEDDILMEVDVSETTYSLFPGQVVLFKGESLTGKELTARQLFLTSAQPLAPPPNLSGHLQMIIAAGPFSLKQQLNLDPLSDLLSYVNKAHPDVLILLGPLVDANHPSIWEKSFDKSVFDLYGKLVQEISQGVPERTTVCIVSSYRDANNIPIYPTRSSFLCTPQFKNVRFFADPSLIDINGVVIGMTSTDSLFHLGKHEISNDSTKRLHRLASHLLNQQSFYPLYPADPDAPVDLKLRSKFANLSTTPHILIIPSDLHHFISDIEESLVINPERLVKGQTGGTFACVEVRPKDPSDEDSWIPATHISSKIVKI